MKYLVARRIAQSLIEVVVGIIVMVPVSLVLIDLGVILYGVQLNDATCRNAVRAAAGGDPLEATPRVQAVIDRANSRTNGIVSNFKLSQPVETTIKSQPQTERDPISGDEVSDGGPVTGTIYATTEVEIKPFAVHGIYGGKSPLKFQSKQSFPISYVRPGH